VPSTPALYRPPQTTPGSASGIYTRSIGAAFLLILVALWATTQWTAWRLHFLPALGIPWLALSPPLRALSWLAAIAGSRGHSSRKARIAPTMGSTEGFWGPIATCSRGAHRSLGEGA
jgi:hypothetical protein